MWRPTLAAGEGSSAETISSVDARMMGLRRHLGLPWWLSDKESACNVVDPVRSLGLEDPLEKGMATNFSILA